MLVKSVLNEEKDTSVRSDILRIASNLYIQGGWLLVVQAERG